MSKINLKDISTSDLEKELSKRKYADSIKKWNTVKITNPEYEIVNSISDDDDYDLYLVRVHDGCEGLECVVQVNRDKDIDEDYIIEVIKHDYITGGIEGGWFDLESEQGLIESIEIEEICRYNKLFILLK